MKLCYKCGKKKPYSEFNKNRAKRDGHGTACRECMNAYSNEHYPQYKKRISDSNKQRKESLRVWFREYKKTLRCESCGYNKSSYALDFHHKDPSIKEDQVCRLINSVSSKQKILNEIKKCKVLCSNCHRELHHID